MVHYCVRDFGMKVLYLHFARAKTRQICRIKMVIVKKELDFVSRSAEVNEREKKRKRKDCNKKEDDQNSVSGAIIASKILFSK